MRLPLLIFAVISLPFGRGQFYAGDMPCEAPPRPQVQSGGLLDPHIFILCLINLFMSVTNGSIAPALTGRRGTGPFTWAFWDLTSFSNFKCFLAFPVSGSETVSMRSFFRAGRRSCACSAFCAVRSALRLAWVSFLSFGSGGSSSAVIPVWMFSAVRYPYPFPSALPVPPPVPLPENAADICSHAGVFGNGVPDRICLCRSVGLSLRKKEHIFRYHGLSHPLLQKNAWKPPAGNCFARCPVSGALSW